MGYILVGTIIGGIIWGIVVNKVIENKGYEENWFWWGFFFGIFALIVALTKQSVNTTRVVIEGSTQVEEKNMETVSNNTLFEKVDIHSPVHISSWDIKKDNNLNMTLFVDFLNVSDKTISAVMFSTKGFNSFGDKVCIDDKDSFDIIGQDLNIKSGEYGKVNVTIQNKEIRKVDVKVKKICFADGTIVDGIQDEWINTNQMPLEYIHIDCATKQNMRAKYYSIIKEHYWQCVCGFVNLHNTCAICGMQKNNALKFTQENIEDIYNEYIKQIEIEKSKEERLKLEEKRLQEEQQVRAKKNKKILAYSTGIVAICVVVATVLNAFVIPNYKYNRAIKLMDEQKQKESIQLLAEIGGYKDSSKIVQDYYKQYREKISVVTYHGYGYNVYDGGVVGLKSNGEVVTVINNDNVAPDISNWKDIVQISINGDRAIGLKTDGTVVSSKSDTRIAAWKDIIDISAGKGHFVGLRADGTVVATGDNKEGQCNVYNWKNIVAISANGYHTVGLTSDGTVVATGSDRYGQCDVSDWENVVDVIAGKSYTLGLKENGTVAAIGDNEKGQCNVLEWRNIVQLAASDSHTVGLKADGTIVAVGQTISVPRNKNEWKDIVAIAAGGNHTVGLKSDGTLVTTFPNVIDISDWDLID